MLLPAGQRSRQIHPKDTGRPRRPTKAAAGDPLGVMVASETDRLIRAAIRGKRLVRFSFQGCVRVAEPHDYGIRDGTVQLLVYQVGGESRSGGLPQWRWVKVAGVTALELLDASFAGGRGDSVSKHSRWDELFLRVAPSTEAR